MALNFFGFGLMRVDHVLLQIRLISIRFGAQVANAVAFVVVRILCCRRRFSILPNWLVDFLFMFIKESRRSEFEVAFVAVHVLLLGFVDINDVLIQHLLPSKNAWTRVARESRNQSIRPSSVSFPNVDIQGPFGRHTADRAL